MKSSNQDRTWSFLVASPTMQDMTFEESVILLLEDNLETTFGVIINKPIGKTLSEIDDSYSNKFLGDTSVFIGGPVAKDKFSIVVWRETSKSQCNFSFGVKAEKAEEFLKNFPDAKASVFMGYAAWGQEQLNKELENKNWLSTPVEEKYILSDAQQNLWQDLLCKINPLYLMLKPLALPDCISVN